jgi:hypothetical protein
MSNKSVELKTLRNVFASSIFIIIFFLLASNRFKHPAPGPEITDSIVVYLPDSIIVFATGLNGIRYRYGGSDRSGFDCSGFTSYVFHKHNIQLPRTSRDQYHIGTKVHRQEIKKADLLFFKGRNANSKFIGHVGIAINNGDEENEVYFVHSASRGGIKIDSLSNPYYQIRYVGASRVLNIHHDPILLKPRPKLIPSFTTLESNSKSSLIK